MHLEAKDGGWYARFARFGAMGRPNGHWAKTAVPVCGCLLTPFSERIGAAAPLREVLATCQNSQIKHTHAQAGHRPTNHAMKAPFLGGGAALAHLLVGRYPGSQLDPPKSPSSKSRNSGLLAAAHARTLLQILLRIKRARTHFFGAKQKRGWEFTSTAHFSRGAALCGCGWVGLQLRQPAKSELV